MTRSVFRFLWVALMIPAVADAQVSGRVVTTTGVAIDHARVEVRGRALVVFADADGRFDLSDSEPPLTIEVSHPRFHTVSREIVANEAIEIVLEVKQEVYEEIVISADRGGGGFSPVSVAASVIDPVDSPVSTLHLDRSHRRVHPASPRTARVGCSRSTRCEASPGSGS